MLRGLFGLFRKKSQPKPVRRQRRVVSRPEPAIQRQTEDESESFLTTLLVNDALSTLHHDTDTAVAPIESTPEPSRDYTGVASLTDLPDLGGGYDPSDSGGSADFGSVDTSDM